MVIWGFNILILAWANCVVAAGHYLHNKCSFYRTKWERSYSPYQISISLKQIQEYLNMDKHMSHDLFNMGVRILATTEHPNWRSSSIKGLWKRFYILTSTMHKLWDTYVVQRYILMEACTHRRYSSRGSISNF
jgi:hypothetical protein